VNLGPRFDDYYLAYILWREKVIIFAVAHAKRRLCYFRCRIREAGRMF
jgi:hypothetical protein